MHAIFMPYGKRSEVELMLRDMEAQKHKLNLYKDGEKKFTYIQGQVRFLPFGIYEYVFPKEDMDIVLTSLKFNRKAPYNLGTTKLALIRKMLKCEEIPVFQDNKKYLWINENVAIIPIGIRRDEDIIDDKEEVKGYKHEAI